MQAILACMDQWSNSAILIWQWYGHASIPSLYPRQVLGTQLLTLKQRESSLFTPGRATAVARGVLLGSAPHQLAVQIQVAPGCLGTRLGTGINARSRPCLLLHAQYPQSHLPSSLQIHGKSKTNLPFPGPMSVQQGRCMFGHHPNCTLLA